MLKQSTDSKESKRSFTVEELNEALMELENVEASGFDDSLNVYKHASGNFKNGLLKTLKEEYR